MKPVNKGQSLGTLAHYKDAKPELVSRLGSHCSYCEKYGDPQDLHVEHIYPKKPHPEHEHEWDNFLLACSTCNNYKHQHLGSGLQTNLENHYLWPHRENTFLAFDYFSDGRMAVATSLADSLKQVAADTLEMIGAGKTPVTAADYKALEIPYDGMEKRKELWNIVEESKAEYLAANGAQSANSLARQASKMGHFSIWMTVFHDRPEVRRALIDHFKADAICFDANAQARTKARV